MANVHRKRGFRRLAFINALVLSQVVEAFRSKSTGNLQTFKPLGFTLESSLLFASAVSLSLEFELHSSIADIKDSDWDACLRPQSSPFLMHSWLACLETSGCASPSTGWAPQHVVIKLNKQVRGYVPLYIKSHSLGEFIFDQEFAEAAHQNGLEYYPKLLVGIPFTPCTGDRILWHPSVRQNVDMLAQLRKAVALFLKQIARANELSSVHINFMQDEEATDLCGPLVLQQDKTKLNNKLLSANYDDYERRTSVKYHWRNRNIKNDSLPFATFNDYLDCFKSKRRITIKRERQKVQHIRVDAIVGKDILNYPGLVERMYELYGSTIDKMGPYGRQYLTLAFFQQLVQSKFLDDLCFMCARETSSGDVLKAADVFAGTFSK
jgi:predicted N-acyltransferase